MLFSTLGPNSLPVVFVQCGQGGKESYSDAGVCTFWRFRFFEIYSVSTRTREFNFSRFCADVFYGPLTPNYVHFKPSLFIIAIFQTTVISNY